MVNPAARPKRPESTLRVAYFNNKATDATAWELLPFLAR